ARYAPSTSQKALANSSLAIFLFDMIGSGIPARYAPSTSQKALANSSLATFCFIHQGGKA
ncbi:MAG TPA: hypothetical protein PKK90_02520, partial [Anaerolineaceae bacterium]|nr:hypothetical protein [Anaerolineaceae bacterium]